MVYFCFSIVKISFLYIPSAETQSDGLFFACWFEFTRLDDNQMIYHLHKVFPNTSIKICGLVVKVS